MRWIKETEAKESFAELLEEVAQGETVVILRGGLKIANPDASDAGVPTLT